jgi:hypothetical protein
MLQLSSYFQFILAQKTASNIYLADSLVTVQLAGAGQKRPNVVGRHDACTKYLFMFVRFKISAPKLFRFSVTNQNKVRIEETQTWKNRDTNNFNNIYECNVTGLVVIENACGIYF